MNYRHVMAQFHAAIWAITLDKYQAIKGFLEIKAAGGDVDAEQVRALVGAARPGEARVADSLAVLPLLGTIVPRGNLMAESSGGVSMQKFTQGFRSLMADPSVKGILLDIDSPGGTVDGVEEFAVELRQAREKKPVYAIANTMAASAAYWIASQAERVFVTPSGMVGSIGVFTEHQNIAGMLEKEGVEPTLISAGKYKVDGSPYGPLSESAKAHTQGIVDEFYGQFVRAVARGRGVSADAVRGGFGEGRAVVARQAVREGMADEVATFDRALNALAYRVRQGAPAGKVAAYQMVVPAETMHVAMNPQLEINGEPVTDADLDAAEASKAAEHAESAPAGLSAVEQADIDRRRRRARAAALRVAAR